ncbi:ATP/GTP-binding protein, partial [Streptomyces sp. SID10815]|nr:ATP/GTP-binding protein [Streptomyces sp. SID10815]
MVAVSAAGAPLGRDAAYDVVVRIGDPASVHDLDPYAESDDPDEAAAFLAEALVGDLDGAGGVTARGAATALAQLLGP